ncbi:CatB-related O-acetyltransferase [uncultured Selenomonas sp.]|nr:CatB-related O-acetyltransferase [uncultured Selenomonas sp.]
MDDGQKSTVMTFGPGSYMVNGSVETGESGEHVLVGRYAALGHRLTFELGLNHDYRRVTTYPFEMLQRRDVPQTNRYGHVNHRQIIIGNDVWIGCDVTILGGVRIGNGAVIGARAVVAKDVPPYAVAVGNPARVIKYRFDEETIRALQQIKWWNRSEEKIKANLHLMKDPARFIAALSVSPADDPVDETVDMMRALRSEGYKLYYFVPDFEAEEAVWQHVIDSYLETYCAADKTALLLHRAPSMSHGMEWAVIAARLETRGADAPLILAHEIQEVFSIPALRTADVFITTKEDISSQCVDYAADADVIIRYGLDHPALLFDSCLA